MNIAYPCFALSIAMALAACDTSAQPKQNTTVRAEQAAKAVAAANSIRFNENEEIDNIKKRLELTSQPGLLGYVALINKVGQVALYTPVKGKITSGGKRLTPPEQLKANYIGGANGGTAYSVMTAPSDEGTYGHSNPYVFFWTPSDQYIQTSMDYVYSDKPFRLREEPLMTTVTEEPRK